MSLRTQASPAHEYMGLTPTWTPRSFRFIRIDWRDCGRTHLLLFDVASRLYGDALTHEKDDVGDLVSYLLAPNRTLREIGVSARDGRMNFLHDFGEVCGVELAKVLRQAKAAPRDFGTTAKSDIWLRKQTDQNDASRRCTSIMRCRA
jgi:hypothetical protein